MKNRSLLPSAIVDIRRRLLRAAAWYQSARTTFEVLRVLDEEALLASAAAARGRRRFIARPGFEV